MLVFGVARHDGSIAAADAFAVAEACVRSPEQVRSCLRRLVAEGLFERQGTGQRATYLPTDAGLRALSTMGIRAVQARQQDLERRDWDGRWHLVAFAIPEARRAARDTLRERLGGLGGAAVHNGLYVSPHDWDKDVTSVSAELGVAEHVTQAATDRLTVGGESEPRALARRLWRLDELAVPLRRVRRALVERPRRPGHHAAPARGPARHRLPARRPGDGDRATEPASTPTRCCPPSCCRGPGPGARPATCWPTAVASPCRSGPRAAGRRCSPRTTTWSTRCRPGRTQRGTNREVRHLLRAPAPAPVGPRQRAPAAQGRARAGRARGPARHRLRVGGRAPLPRGVLALVRARGVPRRRQPAHLADPARARHRPAPVRLQPHGSGRRAHRHARPRVRRAGRLRHGRGLVRGRAGRVPDRPGAEARPVGRGARRRHPHVRRVAVRGLRRRALRDAGARRRAQAAAEAPPAAVGGVQPPGHDPPRRDQGHRRAELRVRRGRRGPALGRTTTTTRSPARPACPAGSRSTPTWPSCCR